MSITITTTTTSAANTYSLLHILLSISGEAYNLRKSEDIPKVSQNPSNNILWRQLVHSGQNQFQNGQFYGVGGVGVPFKGFLKEFQPYPFFPK